MDMANKRNVAKKAGKAARDARFRAAQAQQIEAIPSKAKPRSKLLHTSVPDLHLAVNFH